MKRAASASQTGTRGSQGSRGGEVRKTVFENGLTVVTEEIPALRGVAIGFWIKVGTRHEPAGSEGVSHFLEHMLFKGTRTRSALDISREIEQVGGEINAFTAREYTCFHALTLDRDALLGLEILTDVLLNSRFSPREIERERKVILQEIAMVDECPEELVHDLFFEQLWGKHGLGRSILGSTKSIRGLQRKDILAFFAQNYRPEQLVVTVSGNLPHAKVLRAMRKLRDAKWPGRGSAVERTGSRPVPAAQTGRWWVSRPSEQIHLVWGVPGPAYASPDRLPALLLSAWLGGGMSSVLFQEIREKKGLAYSVDANLFSFEDTGLFSIYAATSMADVVVCVKLIERCVQKTAGKRLSLSELKTVKEGLKGAIGLASDSVESRMSSLGTNEIFFGRRISPEQVCEMVEEVSAEEIRCVAEKLFSRVDASLLALGPRARPGILKELGARLLKK